MESSVLPRYYLLLQRVLNTAYLIKSFLNTSRYIILKCYPRTYSLSFCLQDNGLSKSSTISSSTAEAMRRYMIITDMKTILHQLRDVLMIYSIKFQITLHCKRQFNESESHVAAARREVTSGV